MLLVVAAVISLQGTHHIIHAVSITIAGQYTVLTGLFKDALIS